MTRSVFYLDRHIYLNNCIIEPHRPPMTTFLNAKFPYNILTIDNQSIRLPFFKQLSETTEFWRHLGKTVTELTFSLPSLNPSMYNGHAGVFLGPSDIQKEPYEILSLMPRIKKITFKAALSKIAGGLSKYQIKHPGEKLLPNLEQLTILSKKFTYSRSPLDNVKQLRQVIPKKAKISISTIEIAEFNFNELMSFLEGVTVHEIRMPYTKLTESFMCLLTPDYLPVKRLIFGSVPPKAGFLKRVLEKHKNISDIHLTLRASPKITAFPQITSLHLPCQHERTPMRSLKLLESLENLQRLKISFTTNDCVFGHKMINLPKLQELIINKTTIYCKNCLLSLAHSFPHLERFDGSIQVAQYPEIMNLLFRNWRYLKAMKLSCSDTLVHCGQGLILPEEQRTRLRSLEIETFIGCKLNADDFRQMSQVFPNLNTLSFVFDQARQDLADVVESIVEGFKELNKLCFTSKERMALIRNLNREHIPETHKIAALTCFEPHKLGPTSLRVRTVFRSQLKL